MQDISFYQSHLNEVSRSFAFCIQKLPQPMRHWTSLSYLLCRVLDTIEDSQWDQVQNQKKHYVDFESFILKLPSQEAVRTWAIHFPNEIPQAEKALLSDSYTLFEDLQQLTPSTRSIIQKCVLRMSSGMQYYSEKHHQNPTSRIVDLIDVNRYCYFVAGIVGELLSKLIIEHRPDFEPEAHFMKNAFHFGLFLQKINLLKDQKVDEKESRYLVPNRDLLLASLKENVIGSVNYLKSLPIDEKGYRTFCGWSLFLGLASLPWIQQSIFMNDGSKIPRSVTLELLATIEEIIQDNDAIQSRLEEFLPLLPSLPAVIPSSTEGNSWFHELSGNILNSSELAELRLI